MITLTIDNKEACVPAGSTILQAARAVGLEIPTLCHREGCTPETSCLVCVVRLAQTPGSRERLVPACATRVSEGMVVESETEEVRAARRTALELLLSDHLGDCLGPCQTICPAHVDLPQMIRLIRAGRLPEAVALVKRRIPLPAVLGRICPAMCERGCRRATVDAPVAIRLLKRYVGDWDLAQAQPWQPTVLPSTGRRVAIVGAGPAGLSAAYYLRAEGHDVVLLEGGAEAGGGLRAVPAESLPPEVLQAELASVMLPGLRLYPEVRVETAADLAALRGRYDVVLLACGELHAEQAEALGLPYAHHGLEVDRHTLQTPLAGVFACGSAVSPTRHAVRAVGSGHAAALAIGAYLRTGVAAAAPHAFNVHLGKLAAEELPQYTAGTAQYGRLSPERGEAGGLLPAEATAETARCLHCDCRGLSECRLRYWAERYAAEPRAFHAGRRTYSVETSHPAVRYEPGKCISCGLCVQIAGRAAEPLGLAYVGRGFSVRIAVPWNQSLAAGLQTTARACAEACPTGALTWVGADGGSCAAAPARGAVGVAETADSAAVGEEEASPGGEGEAGE